MNPSLMAPDAEKSVIKAILDSAGKALMEMDFLKETHFAERTNRIVFEAALGIWAGGGNPDYVVIGEALRDAGYPSSIVEEYRTFASGGEQVAYVDAARIIEGKWRLREIARVVEEASGAVFEGSPEDVIDDLERSLLALRGESSDGLRRISTLAVGELRGESGRVESGYREIDARLGGLGAGRLITIASRPGVGKTTIALNLAANAAAEGKRVGVFSLEMSDDELLERLIVREARVSNTMVRAKRLNEDDVSRLAKSLYGMSKWHLYLDDTAALTPFELSARAKRMKNEGGVDLLLVDYVQLITAPKAESRVQELSAITRSLKLLSRELECPIIMMSQLSRASEMRGGQPRLGDLRESGSIENDSDQVIFLWREDEEVHDGDFPYYVNVTIGKNRHGPLGEFPLEFIPSQSRFQSV